MLVCQNTTVRWKASGCKRPYIAHEQQSYGNHLRKSSMTSMIALSRGHEIRNVVWLGLGCGTALSRKQLLKIVNFITMYHNYREHNLLKNLRLR